MAQRVITQLIDDITGEEIKKGGTLLVATEGQFAPFNYFVGNKLTGFEIELTELRDVRQRRDHARSLRGDVLAEPNQRVGLEHLPRRRLGLRRAVHHDVSR